MCLCFCFSTLSLNSSAVEYDPYTGEEMIYDAEEDCYYAPYNSLDFEPIQLYSVSSPCFSDFDINKLPWLDMPSYVQEIVNAERIPSGKVATDYAGEYKLPFMVIIVDGTYCHIYTGYNLMVAVRYTTEEEKENDTPFRYSIISRKSGISANNAVCYRARYRISNYTLYEDWKSISPVSTGNTFNWYYNFEYDISNRDFYFYGVNGTYQDRTFEVVKLNSGQEGLFPQYVIVNNPVSGFASGTIVYHPEVFAGYIGTFTPPSAESLQQATSKGIWETLKEIPTNVANAIKGFFTSLGDRISGFFDNLANKIKSFFLPSEDFFNTYTSDFISYFSDRFGLLYELPDAVIDILQQFIDYSPAESGYSITFPEVVMPVLDNGEWYDKVIIEETDITFEFLEQGAFKTLYSMYRSVIWMIFIFALINLIIRKSERVFGG